MKTVDYKTDHVFIYWDDELTTKEDENQKSKQED